MPSMLSFHASTKQLTCLMTVLLAIGSMAIGQTVTRDLSDPATNSWKPGAWNSASGTIGTSEDTPAGVDANASLEINVQYTGKGFQFYGAGPSKQEIPGRCQKITLYAKAVTDGYGWGLKFADAKGNETVNGKKLEKGLKLETGKWTRVEFDIPTDWPQPIRLTSILGSNWGKRNLKEPSTATLRICKLEATTDVSGVTDRDSLVSITTATPVPRNMFTTDDPVSYTVAVDSWLGKDITAAVNWTVTDAAGATIDRGQNRQQFNGALGMAITPDAKAYGTYTLNLDIKLDSGQSLQRRSRFSRIPTPQDFTGEEKIDSPWGINIHGGAQNVAYDALSRTGFVWIRDYAYTKSWLIKARGDGSYGGWPWYPRMEKKINDAGLMLLPCLMRSMKDGVEAGHMTPTLQWRRELMQILIDFPQYICWELDNEYDLHNTHEPANNWQSYGNYHRVFAQGVHFVNPKLWVVENGTAGIHPDRVEMLIKRGDFAEVDVINAHFYCGTQPPELGAKNANTGQEDQPPALIYDVLRDLVRVADSDGKDRQAWITEFGWDTLAGHVVTEHQQAAYLQRAYMLMLEAGIEKCFWYWNRSATEEKANNFFDGCGILDGNLEPKPASAAMAAMVHLVKAPTPLGSFDMGPNTHGYVVRDRDRIVACVFKVDPQGPTATVNLNEGKLFDMFANPLTPGEYKLDVAPIWMVGLNESSPIVKQTAYDLASRYLVRVAAGDEYTLKIRARNTRKTPLSATFKVNAPDGWTVSRTSGTLGAAPGEEAVAEVVVSIAPQEKAPEHNVTVTVTEGDIEKTLTTQFVVIPGAKINVHPLAGEPGTSKLAVEVFNTTMSPKSFVLKPSVPAGWSVSPETVTVKDIDSGKTQTAEFDVTWDLGFKPGEQATVAVLTPDGRPVTEVGIIPGAISIPQAKAIRLDGKLDDWPATAKLPGWVTGLQGLDPGAEYYAAWSPEGLWIAVNVAESKVYVTDPRSFWSQDVLEVFVDTQGNRSARDAYAATDHQFWFCPLVKEHKVYAGLWKRNDTIKETQYDLADVKGYSVKTDGGYLMEFLIPAARLQGFSPAKGKQIGLNLNLTVHNPNRTSEVYWPRSKQTDAPKNPANWGIVELK